MTKRTTAFAVVAIAAWLAPATGNAAPINYNITISGGITECGRFRPLQLPCDSVIAGSILVDSEGATVAEQLLAFSLEVAPEITYVLSDARYPERNTLTFDESGVLTGFVLPLFRRLDNSQPLVLGQYAVRMAADAQGGYFAFEGAYSDTWNRCTGCVAISATSVSEPGASWLLVPAVAMTLVMATRRRRVLIRI
jgi:hypothetical protein